MSGRECRLLQGRRNKKRGAARLEGRGSTATAGFVAHDFLFYICAWLHKTSMRLSLSLSLSFSFFFSFPSLLLLCWCSYCPLLILRLDARILHTARPPPTPTHLTSHAQQDRARNAKPNSQALIQAPIRASLPLDRPASASKRPGVALAFVRAVFGNGRVRARAHRGQNKERIGSKKGTKQRGKERREGAEEEDGGHGGKQQKRTQTSCTQLANSVPSRAKMRCITKPRPPPLQGLSISVNIHSSARTRRGSWK